MASSTSASATGIRHDWVVVDATDQVLGRLATRVAQVLSGKHRPTYVPHLDTGDFVVVTNAEKIRTDRHQAGREGLPPPHRVSGRTQDGRR